MSIVTLMSSNENNRLTDHQETNTSSTSLHSIVASSISNVSLSHTSLLANQPNKRSWNLLLLIACLSTGIILAVLIVYAVIKYRNRDEGSYKIDESHNFLSKVHGEQQTGKVLSPHSHRQKSNNPTEQNGLDSKEWYV